MNQAQTTGWSPMVSGPDEDFANFLEFSDLQLNFPPFDGIGQNGDRTHQDADIVMDTAMENATEMLGYGEAQVAPQPNHSMSNPLLNGYGGHHGHLYDIQIPAEQFNQRPHVYAKGRPEYTQGMVPPTPNSIEMHGGHAEYYQMPVHQQAHMYEHYQRNQREQMIFTPLVSPAVTPHDAQIRYPDFPMPGEHFSPLTSPAMEAQNQAAQASAQAAMRGSDTSDTTSPIDLNQDFNPSPPISNAAPIRRTRRKTIPTQKNPARSVRQSPAMKPQSRKKQPSSATIPPKEVSGIIEEARKAKQASLTSSVSAKFPLPYSQDSSEAESISPEPLSEILMPPPATPRSSTDGRSPYLKAKQPASQSAPLPPMIDEPATPASLMRSRKQAARGTGKPHEPSKLKEQAALAEAEHEQIMEDIALPEPLKSTRPILAPIKTVEVSDDQATPTMTGQQTPKVGTISAPLTATSSVFPSPQLRGPASPATTGPSKRPDSKVSGRETKKRTNSSSVQVSPALRPRISPSIKPLLPEGTIVSPETSALLLASKSNYQNILEGTHLPGVSYPENLSTNLTSKRTSHKLAEQGRRNRINTALQEMASLLPPTTPSINGSTAKPTPMGAKDGIPAADTLLTGTAAQQSNSKASTVELATEYIKNLQQELLEIKGKLEVAEKKLEFNSESS